MKLSDLECRKAKPANKSYKLIDGRGLYLYIMKSGGKSWRYNYKLKREDGSHKNGTYTYGLYPEITLSEARELHMEAHKLVSQGIDPNNVKKRQELERLKESNFRELTEEWLEKRKGEIKEKTYRTIETRLERDILPVIGDIALKDLSPSIFLSMIRKIEEREAYSLSKRAQQYCGQILKYGVSTSQVERNFMPDIKPATKEYKQGHHPALSPDELPQFLRALQVVQPL